jgi:hypothetical protein
VVQVEGARSSGGAAPLNDVRLRVVLLDDKRALRLANLGACRDFEPNPERDGDEGVDGGTDGWRDVVQDGWCRWMGWWLLGRCG